MRRVTVLAVALLLVAAGCTGISGGPAADTTDAGSPTRGSGTTGGAVVTVAAVVDGDTLEVRYPNGTTDTVRLVGVDTPEVHVENEPAEFEGVPETAAGAACLREAGENASRYVRKAVLGEAVRLTFDAETDRRGEYGRLLAYVNLGSTTLNYRLVARGHARVYDSSFTRADRFYDAEAEARAAGRGLWRCGTATTTAG